MPIIRMARDQLERAAKAWEAALKEEPARNELWSNTTFAADPFLDYTSRSNVRKRPHIFTPPSPV